MEGFLQLKISPWLRMLLTRSVALVPAIMVAVLTEQDSDGSDLLDEWLNVLQSVQLPFALLPVLHFTSSKGIMGNAFVNGPTTRVLMWMIALLVIITNVLLTIGFLADDDKPVPHTWWFYILTGLFGVVYFGFILSIIQEDLWSSWSWMSGKHEANQEIDTSEEENAQLLHSAEVGTKPTI